MTSDTPQEKRPRRIPGFRTPCPSWREVLLACPFCGGGAMPHLYWDNVGVTWYALVECSSTGCKAGGPTCYDTNARSATSAAVDAWNARVTTLN